MSLYRLDVQRLHDLLDTKRRSRSAYPHWQDVARRLDMSPSSFSRIAAGGAPSADNLMGLLVWLDLDTDLLAAGLIRPADQDPT